MEFLFIIVDDLLKCMKKLDNQIKKHCKSLYVKKKFIININYIINRYCRGIIGCVDIPSIVLEPTHNKQSFADEKEYHFLLKNMGEYMRQYWIDTGIEHYIKEFWETYGYQDDQLDRLPS